MTDVALEWNSDWEVDSTGDLLLVDGNTEIQQRLSRRLFTAVHGYVWHPKYGAGLPQKIGSLFTPTQIQAICRTQLNLEATVAVSPPAVIVVTEFPGGAMQIFIQYTATATGVSVSFTITTG
jgi:hypothetical protein